MKTTQRLLKAAQKIWKGYHVHPFVSGIADGTLKQAQFKYYLKQDYLYLIDYIKVFTIGAAKARDIKTMCLFAGYVTHILEEELETHKSYMKQLGISLAEVEESAMSLDNLSYTSYMLRVAYGEGVVEIAVAILACALSYEVIAKEMVRSNPACIEHPFYGEWVCGYVDHSYTKENQKLIALVERLTLNCSVSQICRLEEIFVTCSRYEGIFWDMSWEMRR